MADEDILLRMTLDIEDVETKLDRAKESFEALGGSLNGLNGFSAILDKVTVSISETTAAFEKAAGAVERLTGAKLQGTKADLELSKLELAAARATENRARAEQSLARSIEIRAAAQNKAAAQASRPRSGGNADLYDRTGEVARAARAEYALQYQRAQQQRRKRPVYQDVYDSMLEKRNAGTLDKGRANNFSAQDYALVESKLKDFDGMRATVHEKELARIADEAEARAAAQARIEAGYAQRARREQFSARKEVANQSPAERSASVFSEAFGRQEMAASRSAQLASERIDAEAAKAQRDAINAILQRERIRKNSAEMFRRQLIEAGGPDKLAAEWNAGLEGTTSYKISRFQDKEGEFDKNTLRGGTYVSADRDVEPERGIWGSTVVGYANPKNPLDIDGGVYHAAEKLNPHILPGLLKEIEEMSHAEKMELLGNTDGTEADKAHAETLDDHELGKVLQQRVVHQAAKEYGHDMVRYTRLGGEQVVLDPSIISYDKPPEPIKGSDLAARAAEMGIRPPSGGYAEDRERAAAAEAAAKAKAAEAAAAAKLQAEGAKLLALEERRRLTLAAMIPVLEAQARLESQAANKESLLKSGSMQALLPLWQEQLEKLNQPEAPAFKSLIDQMRPTERAQPRGINTQGLSAHTEETTAAVEALRRGQQEYLEAARLFNQAVNAAGGHEGLAAQLNAEAGAEKYSAAELRAVSAEYREMAGVRARSFPNIWEREIKNMGEHILQYGAFTAAMVLATSAAEALGAAIHKASEFQVQGVLFQNYRDSLKNTEAADTKAGIKRPGVDDTTNNDLMAKSIQLATKYGDEVNDVSQDVALWYKRTGDLNDAQLLTNETLKFQLATGTDLEDTYRTLTGLAAQAGNIKLNKGDKETFGLEKTPELLQKVTAAAIVAGAGLHQVTKEGDEMGKANNNAAVLLLEAMDKDTAALGTLGYSLTDAVAINASLIQAFGNTGNAASEAADKIARISGGIAGLSKPNNATVKEFAKEMEAAGAPADTLNKIFNTQHDVLDNLAKVYGGMSQKQRDQIAVGIAGNRQFEALEAILTGVAGKGEIVRAMQANMNEEDRLAVDMLGTYKVKMEQLNAAWEGFSIAVMSAAMPAITAFIGYLANTAIPVLAQMADGIGSIFNGIGAETDKISTALDYSKHVRAPWEDDDKQRKIRATEERRMSDDDAKIYGIQGSNDLKNTGPVHTYYSYTGANKKRMTGERDFSSEAAFLEARDPNYRYNGQTGSSILKGLPSNVQGALNGSSPMLALENLGNTMRQGMSAADWQHKIKDIFDHREAPAQQGEILDGTGSGTKEKPLTPAQLHAQDMDDTKAAYDDLNFSMKESLKGDDATIARLEKLAKLYGQTAGSLAKYKAAINDKIADDKKTEVVDKAEMAHWKTDEGYDLTQANRAGRGTKEWRAWMGNYRTARGNFQSAETDYDSLDADIDTQNNKKSDAGLAFSTEQLSRLEKYGPNGTMAMRHTDEQIGDATNLGVKAGLVSESEVQNTQHHLEVVQEINKLAAAGNLTQQKKNELLEEEANRYSDALDKAQHLETEDAKALRDKMQSISAKTDEAEDTKNVALAQVGGATPEQLEAMKQQIELRKGLADAVKEYQENLEALPAAESGVAKGLYDAQVAALMAQAAADKFEASLQRLKNSDWGQGLTAAFSEVSKSLIDTAVAADFGDNALKQEISDIEGVIGQLQYQKDFLDTMYSDGAYHNALQAADHKLYMERIDEEVKKLKEKQQAEQYAAEHPPLFKKMAEDFTKTFMDSMMKKAMDQMMQGLTSDPASSNVTTSMQSFVDTATNKLPDTMGIFAQGVKDFSDTIKNSYLDPNYEGSQTDALTEEIAAGVTGSNGMPGQLGSGGRGSSGIGLPALGQVTLDTGSKNSFVNALTTGFNAASSPFGSGFGGSAAAGLGLDKQVSDGVVKGLTDPDVTAKQGAAILNVPNPNGGPDNGSGYTGPDMADAGGGGNNWDVSTTSGPVQTAFNAIASKFGGVNTMTNALDMANAAAGHSEFGSALDQIGGSMTGNASAAKGGVGGYIDAAGNILNSFSQSQDAGWGSVAGTGIGAGLGAMLGNPALGAALGSSLGGMIGGLFGPKISETTNPDMYASSGFAQMVANAGGDGNNGPDAAYTSATGTVFEDPQLQQQLGNKSELQYLDQFVAAHPGGQGLTGEELSLWQEANTDTGGGQAVTVGGLHNGNVEGQNASGQAVTGAQNWNTYLQELQNATQALYGFQQSVGGANQALVVLNQFGGGGSMPYGWNTPGYQFSPQGYQAGGGNGIQAPYVNTTGTTSTTNNPVNPSGTSSTTNPALVASGATTQAMNGAPIVSGRGGVTPVLIVQTNLDGRAIARSTQAYMQQASSQGFSYVS